MRSAEAAPPAAAGGKGAPSGLVRQVPGYTSDKGSGTNSTVASSCKDARVQAAVSALARQAAGAGTLLPISLPHCNAAMSRPA